MRLIFDIETNGFLEVTTTVHSLCIKDADTGEKWSCHHETIEDGLRLLTEASQIIGHNIIKFDLPAIQKVYPWFTYDEAKVLDTLTCSRLIWPEIKEQDFNFVRKAEKRLARAMEEWERVHQVTIGCEEDGTPIIRDDGTPKPEYDGLPKNMIGRHGLEAWGHRLGLHKGDYAKEMKAKGLDPWAEWNEAMQSYCELDVEVTHALLQKIESKEYSQQAIELEHRFQWIIWKQEQHGFPFDIPKAEALQHKLVARRLELEQALQEAFPPWEVKTPFVPKVNNKKRGYVKGCLTYKVKEVVFNPGSRDHIANRLMEVRGWKPNEFTNNGKPKVDETILNKLDYPEAKLLSEYLMIQKRLGQLAEGKNAWLNMVKPDGRIHGEVITNGAVTGRCTHKNPNVAQTPSVGAPYGTECRELFTVLPGYKLVGADASGLELRCLGHYMAKFDGGTFVSVLLEADVHWANVQAMGLTKDDRDGENKIHKTYRDGAKTFIYGFL